MLAALVPEGVPRGRGTERFHDVWRTQFMASE